MAPPPEPPTHRRLDMVLCIAFAVGLWLPLGTMALGVGGDAQVHEMRPPRERPPIAWHWRMLDTYPARFTGYWDDSFGMRASLLWFHALVHARVLGVSSSPKVLLGRDGWLFIEPSRFPGGDAPQSALDHAQLECWRLHLEARRAAVVGAGAAYLFVVAPNKRSVYPEFLPAGAGPSERDRQCDQLVAHLREHSSIDVLDLRPTLREASTRVRTYHRTDTHWNGEGARAAYRALLDRLAEQGVPVSPRDDTAFVHTRIRRPGGDIARMLCLPDVLNEDDLAVSHLAPRARKISPDGAPDDHTVVWETPDETLPTLVMSGDSFARALTPLLSEHFRRLTLVVHSRLSARLLERERPEVVIDEIAERNLARIPAVKDGGVSSR